LGLIQGLCVFVKQAVLLKLTLARPRQLRCSRPVSVEQVVEDADWRMTKEKLPELIAYLDLTLESHLWPQGAATEYSSRNHIQTCIRRARRPTRTRLAEHRKSTTLTESSSMPPSIMRFRFARR